MAVNPEDVDVGEHQQDADDDDHNQDEYFHLSLVVMDGWVSKCMIFKEEESTWKKQSRALCLSVVAACMSLCLPALSSYLSLNESTDGVDPVREGRIGLRQN